MHVSYFPKVPVKHNQCFWASGPEVSSMHRACSEDDASQLRDCLTCLNGMHAEVTTDMVRTAGGVCRHQDI